MRLWRHKNALTLKAAASRIGIHPSTLARIERGESMHGATLSTLLVWLLGREEPTKNETFPFEAEDAVAGETKNGSEGSNGGSELERDPYKLDEGEAGKAHGASLISCDKKRSSTTQAIESKAEAESEIEEEQETSAEHSLHAVDQVPPVCSMLADGLGGGTHGSTGTGPEVAG